MPEVTLLPAHEKSCLLIHSLPPEVVQRGLGKKTRLVHYIAKAKQILNVNAIFLVILLFFWSQMFFNGWYIHAHISCS